MSVPLRAFLLGATLVVAAALVWTLWGTVWGGAPTKSQPSAASSATDPWALLRERAQTSRSESSGPSAADSALIELRRAGLSLPTRRAPSLRISVSGDRVIRVTEDAVFINEAPSGKDEKVALKGAFAVSELPFDGMFALGKERMLVFDAAVRPRDLPSSHPQMDANQTSNQAGEADHGQKAGARDPHQPGSGAESPFFRRELPRPTVLPGSRLLPDRRDTTKMWVWHQGGSTLYGYDLAPGGESVLAPQDAATLPEFDGRVLLPLKDGSLVYSRGGKLSRLFIGGRPSPLSPVYEGAPMVRGLLARRVDEFMILYEDGTIERLHLQNRLRRRALHRFARLPVDIVSNSHGLAVLFADQREGAPRRWRLRFLTLAFSLIDEIDLPGGLAAPGPDWLEKETRNRLLAANGRWVAMGGPTELRVWDLLSLKAKQSHRATR